MRQCACRHCQARYVIGHPEAQLHARAKELARKEVGILARIAGRARQRAQELEEELIEAFYEADASRLKSLPSRCPQCRARDGHELPWWEPR